MEKCKPIDTPIATGTKVSKEDKGPIVDPTLYKKLVDNLMYLTTPRPDITYGVSLISKFMESPKGCHWKIGKIIMRYIAGTTNYGILYLPSNSSSLIGYTNSDFVGSLDD